MFTPCNAPIRLRLHSLSADLHLRPNSIFTTVYRGTGSTEEGTGASDIKVDLPGSQYRSTQLCSSTTPAHQEFTYTANMLKFVIICATLLCAADARPSLEYLENLFTPVEGSEEVRSAAMKRLLEVFGMEDPPAIHGNKHPPQYMLDLYNAVADVDGVTKDPHLLEGNTVRSFFDKCKICYDPRMCVRSCCYMEDNYGLFLITNYSLSFHSAQ